MYLQMNDRVPSTRPQASKLLSTCPDFTISHKSPMCIIWDIWTSIAIGYDMAPRPQLAGMPAQHLLNIELGAFVSVGLSAHSSGCELQSLSGQQMLFRVMWGSHNPKSAPSAGCLRRVPALRSSQPPAVNTSYAVRIPCARS